MFAHYSVSIRVFGYFFFFAIFVLALNKKSMVKFAFVSREHNDIDVNAVYHQLVATYTSDSDENPQPGTSTGTTTPAGRRRFVL